jgi:hypothetical protein
MALNYLQICYFLRKLFDNAVSTAEVRACVASTEILEGISKRGVCDRLEVTLLNSSADTEGCYEKPHSR